ncbi:hypothetical protein Patl1_31806 [Pistacia atlantica]|uniref:Uncharacterized protein n=1 Tax=Pistacia atlantica TaxID=434234 RepID=A0ACC1ALX6_9ROSI|nr:hypothetical protein Patl1_31806 [Pistacia atlantica]
MFNGATHKAEGRVEDKTGGTRFISW